MILCERPIGEDGVLSIMLLLHQNDPLDKLEGA